MNRFFIVCLALLLPFAGFVAADWKALDESYRGEGNWQINVLSATDQEVKVEITVPGYHERKVTVGDTECLMFQIPGCAMLMEKGYPMVPMLSKLVKLQHDCEIKMEVVSKEEADVKLCAPIVPSKGHFTRDIDPESVPFEFGPIYKTDVFWPEEKDQFQMSKPFEFRDVCGVRVQILPLRANHVQMTMKVLKKAVLVFKMQHSATRSLRARTVENPGRAHRRLYSEFLNYEAPQVDTRVMYARGEMPNPNSKKLVVVTPEEFAGVLGTWVEWKRKSGYEVTVKSVASGTTASQIKSYLQGLYDNAGSKFGYVVLIGDAGYTSNFEQAKPMPTFKGKKEGAAADRVYVRLAGNDNYPDAFVSRISGTTAAEIQTQLDKIVNYEKNPPAGDWYNAGTCIASDQGSPTDKQRTEWLQNGGGQGQKIPVVDSGLTGYGYTKFDDIYDPYAYASDVAKAVNEGRSIMCYIGHGSATSWVSSGFSVSDVKKLTNGAMLPVIWSVACVNGQFVHTAECFAEAWLRKANGGAVAMECGSTNESWVPPCDKQAATINAIIKKQYSTFGALEAIGCIKALEVWGDTDSSEGNKLAEQCNLFGDCTLIVRTKKPVAVTANATRDYAGVVFDVTAEGRAPEFATVTVYTQDMSFSVSGDVDEQGRVNLSLQGAPEGQLFYTVVGSDLQPIVDQPLQ